VRRLALSLLMLAVLLPSAAFARVAYLCSMDGKVRSACCCPAKTQTQPRDPAPLTSMKSACCCEVSTLAPTRTAAADPPRVSAQLQPELVAIEPAPISAPPPRHLASFAPRSHAPPDPVDRSLFASHCALLL
jgi:hypothetical protein